MPHQNKITAFVIARLFNSQQIRRALYYAERTVAANRVLTNSTHFGVGKVLATLATTNPLHGITQRIRKPGTTGTGAFKQVKGHALGGLLAHTRQTPEGFNEFINQRAERHETSSSNSRLGTNFKKAS